MQKNLKKSGPKTEYGRLCRKMLIALYRVFDSRGIFKKLPGTHGARESITISKVFDIQLADFNIFAFEIDVSTLPVSIELFQDPGLVAQVSAALHGRKTVVSTERGLAILIAKDLPAVITGQSLPEAVELNHEDLVTIPYSFPLGRSAKGTTWTTLERTSHILIGGESRSGKSMWLNAALISLLVSNGPEDLKVAIIDPKVVEFNHYRGDPHLLQVAGQDAIATEVSEAQAVLLFIEHEIAERARRFTELLARNLGEFNARVADKEERLPRILIIIDEVTDIALTAGLRSKFYTSLIKIASKGAAFGITLFLATQNPKAEVLNTLIRGNMSTRIAFRVATIEHSKTILGQGGAHLLPRGLPGRMMVRYDGPLKVLQGLIATPEVFGFRGSNEDNTPLSATLTPLEVKIVEYVLIELEGLFKIAKIAKQFKGKISHVKVGQLSQTYEAIGWLKAGRRRRDSKIITKELENVYEHVLQSTAQGTGRREMARAPSNTV